MDKTGWPRGEWDDEPDVLDFEIHGLRCHIARMSWGNLNGYVGVPPGHEFHGVGYNSFDEEMGVWTQVHGGLTYAAEREDGWWYFGFDIALPVDYRPGMPSTRGGSLGTGGSYRNLEYVKKEVERLAVYLTLLTTSPELARIFNDSSG